MSAPVRAAASIALAAPVAAGLVWLTTYALIPGAVWVLAVFAALLGALP